MKQAKLLTGVSTLTVLVILGAVTTAIRYIDGLGATTNLSDGRAWGLWISAKFCFIALGAGAFVLAAVVYIFNLKKYRPIARPAVLTGFIAYTVFVLALLLDLGQPWDIWQVLIYWNVHSPLFEVAMCVMSYLIVLALEFSPAVFERFNWHIPLRVIRAIQIPLVIAGVVISTLHQSTLGTMMTAMPETLNALWYTLILPVFFLLSAIAAGIAVLIAEKTFSTRIFGPKLELDIIGGLGKAVPYVLGLYLLLKLVDLGVAGELGLVFTAYPQNLLWWGEVIIGVILPIILFSMPSVRQSRRALFWSAVLIIIGLILNRFNVTILGLEMRPGFSYFPHWMEFAITAGLVADSLVVVWLANRFLPMASQRDNGG